MTKPDISLIMIVLALVLGCYFLFDMSRSIEKYAVIEIDGREERKIKLSEKMTFDVSGREGLMTLETDGKKIRVLESCCPNKVCVNSGWINKNGQTIVCLPNRVSIKIKGEEKEPDGITR